jgi:signal transduction histidine kinase
MSIRGRLLAGLLSGLIGLYVAAGVTMYFSARAFLQRQFDTTLAAKAQSLASQLRLTAGGHVALEQLESSPAWNGTAGSAEFYEIWAEDGSPLLRAPVLGQNDLRRVPLGGSLAEGPSFADALLPGGSSGRIVSFQMSPAPEEEDESGDGSAAGKGPASAAKTVVVAVAEDTRELEHFLSILLRASLLTTLAATAGTVIIVRVAVRRGLRPLQDVAARAAGIDEQSLHIRFPLAGVPAELRPICLRLNASLQRLQQAFERERRFTADVAHELRTPIAELRALADVALRGGDADTSAGYFSDARDIAVQMERIVATLLALARCHAGTTVAVREPIDVSAALMDAWNCSRAEATARGVTARFEMPPQVTVVTDRTMLQSVLVNLLGNAAEHGKSGGTVVCQAGIEGEKRRIRVVNPVDDLEPADVGHLFEPFWRKDAARTDNSHSGLGLTLVRAYAEMLGGSATAGLIDGNSLCVEVEIPVGDNT